eukprot:Gb_36388 [translate_table: standard]
MLVALKYCSTGYMNISGLFPLFCQCLCMGCILKQIDFAGTGTNISQAVHLGEECIFYKSRPWLEEEVTLTTLLANYSLLDAMDGKLLGNGPPNEAKVLNLGARSGYGISRLVLEFRWMKKPMKLRKNAPYTKLDRESCGGVTLGGKYYNFHHSKSCAGDMSAKNCRA